MKKENSQPATKGDLKAVATGLTADIEALAASTAKEFVAVHRKSDTLNEKMDIGFADMRQEMREGFKMVLAAVETVEYTKLRMRLDSLETDVTRLKEKARLR